jgi:hypothetical protein
LIATNVSAMENKNQTFNRIFEQEKTRILSLPEYTIARQKFIQFTNDLEEQKKILIKKMHDDKEYQNAFAKIKQEIQTSGTIHRNKTLSAAEADQLITRLDQQFFPEK